MRLVLIDVEAGTGDFPAGQGGYQVIFMYDRAAGNLDQEAFGPQGIQTRFMNQIFGVSTARTGQHKII